MPQVITIAADGTMSGLQRKPGQGVDLRQFGKASIERASEIEWQEDQQAWAVRIMGQTFLCGQILSFHLFSRTIDCTIRATESNLDDLAPSGWRRENALHGRLLFENYDEAVKVEIQFLDTLRLRGTS